MRANVIVLLVGAFGLYWIGYELNGHGLLLPLVLLSVVGVLVTFVVREQRRNRQRDMQPPALSAPTTAAPPSATATPSFRHEAAAMPNIDRALDALPADILRRSGSVFYSGRAAFRKPSELYILGLNPGGDPVAQAAETVEEDIRQFRIQPELWSAYRDESWRGKPPGTWGMQPRVLHMLNRLGLDPQTVPASNVVFVRSSTEAALRNEKAKLLKSCWPVHQAVIESLGCRTILCFGSTAGRWVREALDVRTRVAEFRERNARGWTSEAHVGAGGKYVITVTHPGRADWRNPDADPTPLVRQMLSR